MYWATGPTEGDDQFRVLRLRSDVGASRNMERIARSFYFIYLCIYLFFGVVDLTYQLPADQTSFADVICSARIGRTLVLAIISHLWSRFATLQPLLAVKEKSTSTIVKRQSEYLWKIWEKSSWNTYKKVPAIFWRKQELHNFEKRPECHLESRQSWRWRIVLYSFPVRDSALQSSRLRTRPITWIIFLFLIFFFSLFLRLWILERHEKENRVSLSISRSLVTFFLNILVCI